MGFYQSNDPTNRVKALKEHRSKGLGFNPMPHSHTLTATVSVAGTISRPLGFMQAWEHERRVVGPHTDCCCCCILVESLTPCKRLQGHHSAKPHTSCQVPRCHVRTCCSRCRELIDTRALSTNRSSLLVCRRLSLPAYTGVTNFCHLFRHRNGIGLYVGRLTREYIP